MRAGALMVLKSVVSSRLASSRSPRFFKLNSILQLPVLRTGGGHRYHPEVMSKVRRGNFILLTFSLRSRASPRTKLVLGLSTKLLDPDSGSSCAVGNKFI